MSKPRKVLPGTTYLLTRSTVDRRFFLAPNDSLVALVFWFCIAVAARLFSIDIHAVCVMSTHLHIVFTDARGNHPRFLQWLFRHSALCLKRLRNIDESVWSARKPNCVELRTPQAILEAIAYTLANPASSGLLPEAKAWPGAISRPEDLSGREVEVEVPPLYFGRRWKADQLRLSMPAALAAEHGVEATIEAIKGRIRQLEETKAAELRAAGKSFLGLDRVLRTKPMDRPRTERGEPAGTGLVPSLKALCREAMAEGREELRAFLQAYSEALEAWRAGERQVLFPAGTWWMARFHGAMVAAPD
ncbi:MAG: transposase [Acidobacteriota bacterium]